MRICDICRREEAVVTIDAGNACLREIQEVLQKKAERKHEEKKPEQAQKP